MVRCRKQHKGKEKVVRARGKRMHRARTAWCTARTARASPSCSQRMLNNVTPLKDKFVSGAPCHGKLAKPSQQMALEKIFGIQDQSCRMLYLSHKRCGSGHDTP